MPIVAESTFLLYSLNEHLKRTPLLVQPLVLPAGSDPGELPVQIGHSAGVVPMWVTC